MPSDEFFSTGGGFAKYTFIYVDGCHEPEWVRRDLINSFAVLETGGIMWMDDYLGADGRSIKNVMDSFLEERRASLELLHSGYQLAIRKT